MKFKSLLLLAASTSTLAFAQNNYQTQYITGTYFDQSYQNNTTSGAALNSADERLQENQMVSDRQGSQGQVANTQDRMTPNGSPQNFNESSPRVGR